MVLILVEIGVVDMSIMVLIFNGMLDEGFVI